MKTFTKEEILHVRKSLRNAGESIPHNVVDIDLACDMLGELLSLKHNENSVMNLCKKYFAHPNAPSKTKKKMMRKTFRELLKKNDTFIRE